MSLINQVLKDLERRQAPERPETPRPATASYRRSMPPTAWWLFAAVVTGAAVHWLLALDAPTDPVQSQIVQASFEPLPAQPPLPESQPQRLAETTDMPTSSPEQTGPDKAEPADAPAAPGSLATPIEIRSTEPPSMNDAARPADEPRESGEGTESEPPPADRSMSIERADQGREQDLDNIRRAIARGHHQRAERELRQLLEQQPEHDEARELLAANLVRRGRPGAAVDVLEQGLQDGQEPSRFAVRLGRVLLERDQVERARDILERHAPAPAEADHQQLLAAAHRQAGDHAAAEVAYRRLTELVPQRAAAWIGLGVSLEALDRAPEAHRAYERVLETGDPQAIRFARQRLRAITLPDGERS